MPEFHQIETVQGYSADKILLLSFATFLKLGWQPVFADADKIIALTPSGRFRKGQSVQVEAAPSTLIVKSEMVNNENWDLMKKNRKNVQQFLGEYFTVQEGAVAEKYNQWEDELARLQQQTIFQIEEQKNEVESLDNVMNLSRGSMWVSYVIMGLNLAIFLWMTFSGVSVFEPSVEDLLKWGGNYRPLTTGGEWWRLFTAVFVHVGLIHIVFNMYALYMVGMYLEPMLGKMRFISAYIATGLIASLVSIWWNEDTIVSAGASGAIFGLYGVLLAILSTKLIPAAARTSLITSIGIFVLYNLIYGAGSNAVDNAAHLGGLASGLLTGFFYLPGIRNRSSNSGFSVAMLTITISIVISAVYLFNTKDDSLAYESSIKEIMKLQEDAISVLEYGQEDDLLVLAATVSQPKWEQAKLIIDETKEYTLREGLSNHRKLMLEYIDLRIQHINLVIISLQGREVVDDEIEEVAKKINAVTDKMEEPNN